MLGWSSRVIQLSLPRSKMTPWFWRRSSSSLGSTKTEVASGQYRSIVTGKDFLILWRQKDWKFRIMQPWQRKMMGLCVSIQKTQPTILQIIRVSCWMLFWIISALWTISANCKSCRSADFWQSQVRFPMRTCCQLSASWRTKLLIW